MKIPTNAMILRIPKQEESSLRKKIESHIETIYFVRFPEDENEQLSEVSLD